MMETSQDIVSCYPVNSYLVCHWISRDENLHVQLNEGQIMKVIDLKKQPKNKILFIGIVYKAT